MMSAGHKWWGCRSFCSGFNLWDFRPIF